METRSILLFLTALFLCLFISNILRSQSEVDTLNGHATTYQQVAERDEFPTSPVGAAKSPNYRMEDLHDPLTARENAIEGDRQVEDVVGANNNIPEPVILDMEVMSK